MTLRRKVSFVAVLALVVLSLGAANLNTPFPSAAPGAATSLSSQSSLTTAVVVKASAGNVYGWTATNAAVAVCYLEFMNAASGPTLGTAAVFSIPIAASGSVVAMPGEFPVNAFSTGISVGLATTYNGASACGSAGTAAIFYK
jgi:hypothetical protein